MAFESLRAGCCLIPCLYSRTKGRAGLLRGAAYTRIRRNSWSKGGDGRLRGQVADLAGGWGHRLAAHCLQSVENEQVAGWPNGRAVALDKVAEIDPGRCVWFGRRTK